MTCRMKCKVSGFETSGATRETKYTFSGLLPISILRGAEPASRYRVQR